MTMMGRQRQEATLEELAKLFREATLEIVAQGLLHDYAKTFEQVDRLHHNLIGCIEAASFLMHVGHEHERNEASPKLRKLARSLLARHVLPSITGKIDNNSEFHLFHDYFSTPDLECVRLKSIISFFQIKANCDISGRDLQNVRDFVQALTLHIEVLINNTIQLEDLTKLVIATNSWEAMPLAGIPALYTYLRDLLLKRDANLSIHEPPKDPGVLEWPLWKKFTWRSISCSICNRCEEIFSELKPEELVKLYKQDEQKIALLLLKTSTYNHTSITGLGPAQKLTKLMKQMIGCKLTWELAKKQ